MGKSEKQPMNESFYYLKKSYDSLNNQQSSTETAPNLYPDQNPPKEPTTPSESNQNQSSSNSESSNT